MTSKPDVETNASCPRIGWTDGLLGFVAGSSAGLCCVGPWLFGVLGFSSLAGTLTFLPFVYHLVLQWMAAAILVGTWGWFLYKWFQLPANQQWNRTSMITGLFLLGITIYVFRSWAIHVLT